MFDYLILGIITSKKGILTTAKHWYWHWPIASNRSVIATVCLFIYKSMFVSKIVQKLPDRSEMGQYLSYFGIEK